MSKKTKPFSAEVMQSLGVPTRPLTGLAVQAAQTPALFTNDAALGALAVALVEYETAHPQADSVLSLNAKPYRTWGAEGIDAGAIVQMDAAMSLPVSVAGALMPDAHLGYGLPIGGVLATEGSVIPYAVGVDIACRMRLSVFEQSPIMIAQQKARFEKALQNNTRFGAGVEWNPRKDDAVLDDPDWQALPQLRGLHGKAIKQLGTSGSGNHFVEWGELDLTVDGALGDLPAGKYLALLSHSGSRGVGFAIANTYSKIAREMHPLLAKRGGDLANLGWLPLTSAAGRLWLAMNLAGQFAAANHRVIHALLAKALGIKPAAVVENHHNFAWREILADGRAVITHRKGATPAGAGVLGVIPGSMADPGYVVRGRGNADAPHQGAVVDHQDSARHLSARPWGHAAGRRARRGPAGLQKHRRCDRGAA